MKLNHLTALVAAACMTLAFSANAADTGQKAAEHGAKAADHGPHWTYEGSHDPKHWGEMDPAFAECKLGKQQSPIDIHGAQKAALAPLAFSYVAGGAEVINNGHTIQVNLADGGSAKLGGADFKLLQFHFHTPSEEMVNGKSYPMVAHMVHKNGEGKLAVVAVLFKEGKENTALKPVFAGLPAKEGGKQALAAGFNPTDLLPVDRAYYKYTGSLTTPPCSEGVQWQVLKQPVELSSSQIAAFRKLYKMNARPVQPLNGRKIEES